jgi:hypothetical protein
MRHVDRNESCVDLLEPIEQLDDIVVPSELLDLLRLLLRRGWQV